MGWTAFDNGRSIGTLGSESGVIVKDEEHDNGARITLERNTRNTPFSITCGIYGWMVHTRFFRTEHEAQTEFDSMSVELSEITKMIPLKTDTEIDSKVRKLCEAISDFVGRFP